MTKITAILPAYNEEVSIGSVVLNTKKYVGSIIVVDDGSTDNTVEIAELAGAQVIRHSSNKGKGAALKTGFEAAKSSEIIITMDSDAQHDPKEIPKLIAPIINGEADIVNGSRYINGNKKDTPSYRRVGQTVLDRATNLGSGLDITDSQSGFRAFARHAIPAFRFSSVDFGIESEMLTDAANAGLRIKEVEINVRYDVDGSTKNPLTHGIGVLMRVLNDLEFQKPLYYFTLPGSLIIIVGVILGLIFFGDYLGGTSKSLAPTVIAIMMTLVGGFLAFTGIILDSMSRMINRVVNTPNYDTNSNKVSSTDHKFKQHGK